jgi:hypothetical protein
MRPHKAGWVERSDTHQLQFAMLMGFARTRPVPRVRARVNVRNHEPFASRNADSNAVKNIVHIMMATMASRSSAIFQM